MPYFRCLQIITAIALALSGGCLGKSAATRFYTLTPLPDAPSSAEKVNPARHAAVGIGPIKLADYLDQSELVTRTSDNRLSLAQFDQWAGSLEDNLTNVVAENIGGLVPTDRIYLYPWRSADQIDYQVVLDVVRCDGQLGEAAWLVVRWNLIGRQDKRVLATSRSSIREPVEGADFDALVAAQSRALAELSREIVAAIHAASREGAHEK
ncbi:MAG: PqiC family protein [Desulfobacterales bacterium]